MHGKFSGRFPDYTIFIYKFKTEVLFIHEKILVCKLETSRNCEEVKHIMILIIYITYTFLIWCDIWSQLKITFRKSSGLSPVKKSISPFFLNNPLKILKFEVPTPLFAKIEKFLDPRALQKERGVTMFLNL